MNTDFISLSDLTEEETRLVSAWREIPAERKAVIAYLLRDYGLYNNDMEKILYESTDKVIEQYAENKANELTEKWNRAAEVLNHIGNKGITKLFIHLRIIAESGSYWENENSKKWHEEQKTDKPKVKGMAEKRNYINAVFQRININGKEHALNDLYHIADDLSNWSNKREWKAYCSIEANANKQTAYRDMKTALKA